MKKSNMVLIVGAALLMATATGCSGNKEAKSDNKAQTEVADADIRGQWYIENIVFNDSDYVRPSEEVPGVSQYIEFEDSTYFIQTNCNTFSGAYAIKGDSIMLGDGAMTEMACDNMTTEDAIRRILPNIATVYVENDSIARLDSRNPSEYIVLKKVTDKNK